MGLFKKKLKETILKKSQIFSYNFPYSVTCPFGKKQKGRGERRIRISSHECKYCPDCIEYNSIFKTVRCSFRKPK